MSEPDLQRLRIDRSGGAPRAARGGSALAIAALLLLVGYAAWNEAGKRAGPDLAGVSERRDAEWLKKFLKDPPTMLTSDSLAMAMLAEYKNVKMPNMKLTDADIDALIHYIADETAKKKK